MTDIKTLEELKEKLAAIEHERWADWQNWVHKVYLEGNFGEYMLRWQRQINTPYSELSEKEKQSDRDQVDRYWPLINRLIVEAKRNTLQDVLNRDMFKNPDPTEGQIKLKQSIEQDLKALSNNLSIGDV